MKILLVEDTRVDRRIAEHRLHGIMDVEILEANDLAQALGLADQADVVLADLGLPDAEPEQTIAALAATGHPRIVFFTGDPRLQQQARAAGARVVSKDDDDDAWRAALR